MKRLFLAAAVLALPAVASAHPYGRGGAYYRHGGYGPYARPYYGPRYGYGYTLPRPYVTVTPGFVAPYAAPYYGTPVVPRVWVRGHWRMFPVPHWVPGHWSY